MLLLRNLDRLLFGLAFTTVTLGADTVSEQAVITQAENYLPSWATDNALQLELSTDSTNYAVIPLTENLGRDRSDRERGIVNIEGRIKAARSANYRQINDSRDVAYMCCDESDNNNAVDRSKMLNELMGVKPKAIILYSTARNWCSITYDQQLPYTSILSMVDPAEAITILNHLNETDDGEVVRVSITGNTTNMDPGSSDVQIGNKSAVAMSVLYSITGVITLLFVVIISTGAIRAHRYPDRYGPRRAHGGRPRQSRAKGLARAVLETLPIVKFGDRQQQPKPDPDMEMETATTDGQEAPVQRAPSVSSDRRSNQATQDSLSVQQRKEDETDSSKPLDQAPGCSICTEDFKVGEDVRVLPCNHQYHPACIDPWLINISGTCPLCRLDLQPNRNREKTTPRSEEGNTLPPPLSLEREDSDGAQASYRTRLSRMFDVNRFQQSSPEEQMAAIRELRDTAANAELPNPELEDNEDEARNQGAGFADRLRERFRILTRSQSAAQRREC